MGALTSVMYTSSQFTYVYIILDFWMNNLKQKLKKWKNLKNQVANLPQVHQKYPILLEEQDQNLNL